MIFFRIIFIIFIALKYRLDEFIQLRKNIVITFIFYPLNLFKPKKDDRAVRLRLALENLGPIFIKFGQMLSTRKDLLPSDIAIELSKLQDKVPPFEFKEVKKTIENSYSKKITSIFKEFDQIPVASASVAQVHFAKLLNGEKVAVKVLRPNIENEVKKDIKLLHLIANILFRLWSDGKRLKPDEVVSEFEKHTQSELNLLLEAGHCSHLGENFKDKKLLVVPNVFWDHCHEKVMVMERMDGIPISDITVIKKNKINLSELAKNGVEIFFTQVFRDGFFHADMHPGNIQVAKDGKYIAMDFGIMGTLNEQDKLYLAKNFAAFFKRDYREVARVHIESGWVPAETSIDEFENAIRSVCEPIFNKPLKDISFGKLLIRLFQTSKKFDMEIQPQLTMLQKTLLNVEGLGRELDPNLDLWVTARPFLENWLKEQIGPKNLLNSIKKEFPNWLDIAPQLPMLLHSYLKNNNQNSYTVIEKNMRQSIDELKLKQDRLLLALIIFILVLLVITFSLI
ncbi:MAG: ubiquinone biosynthesis regulatory protein kinase UbiB [Nitrosomonadales bacterium]|jgi:ubiquinone biosynthesis protein|nr:ubiquinone biosynthesis regulatory protein kinase UbiB [Nitrosomonadales bacterium]MBT6603373.1 ubiquinone biosynthesis regulatory protein kinase UbiB [Nitrosomonadales bacterium]MBT7120784.1 ubiquinone biosynthesis regulatory protein kinase UbiB [Nitrosomonadales bacterium]MBT7689908.1 ubiquinone biosynthesis regulatory protein kinase UbiB [Nitrosomonadales bacterium]